MSGPSIALLIHSLRKPRINCPPSKSSAALLLADSFINAFSRRGSEKYPQVHILSDVAKSSQKFLCYFYHNGRLPQIWCVTSAKKKTRLLKWDHTFPTPVWKQLY